MRYLFPCITPTRIKSKFLITFEMAFNLWTLMHRKKDSSFRKLRFTSAQFGYHDFFSSDAEHIGALLFNFLNNLVDLSINEVNVHYLGHSEVIAFTLLFCVSYWIKSFKYLCKTLRKLKFDYPYKSYERNIRRLTSSYYQDQYEIFYQTPDLFLPFLEADYRQVSRIGNHKLKYLLEKIKIEAWLDFFKNWCLRQVEKKSLDIPFVRKLNFGLFFSGCFQGFALWIWKS